MAHVNLAPSFRGGERQTELLIRGHARAGLRQRAIVRRGAPLADRLRDVPGLELRPIGRPFHWHLLALAGVPLVHAHETRAAQFAFLANQFLGNPYVITRRVPNRPKANGFTAAVYRRAACVVSISTAIQKTMTEYLPNGWHELIPSMVAAFESTPEDAVRIRASYPDSILVVHAGALVQRHKGQHLIIEAARLLRADSVRYDFLLLGEGPDEARLRAQASDLDNVHFLGFRHDVADYLRAADIFLYPSLEEGLGSTLLDAMAARTPVIASATGGIPDIVHGEDNGLLVAPGDTKAIADALRRLGADLERRRDLGEGGHRTARHYGSDAISSRYRQLYDDVLAG